MAIQMNNYLRAKWQSCQQAVRKFLRTASFLIFQEKCRICKRFIHPEIANMDYELFRPPAAYFVGSQQIESDVICRLCMDPFNKIAPQCIVHQRLLEGGEVQRLLIASGTIFDDEIKRLIYRFKYDKDVLLMKDFTSLTYQAWTKVANTIDPSRALIMPVPLHWHRLRERTFNQSECLANELSKVINIKSAAGALKRIKKTRSQQKLGKLQRLTNVANAFSAKEEQIRGKQIILIDDVCTSGATLSECCKALYEAGASLVIAITVARVQLTVTQSKSALKSGGRNSDISL
jgi:ComF family protein